MEGHLVATNIPGLLKDLKTGVLHNQKGIEEYKKRKADKQKDKIFQDVLARLERIEKHLGL